MKVSIFGTGYVGLVTGVCLADIGNDVLCIDTNSKKIATLQQGKSPIYEPGMDELLTKNIKSGNLKFTQDQQQGIAHGEIIFIAVGTPSANDGSADLQYVQTVAKVIGKNIASYRVIVNKSTVPVGTGDKVRTIINKELKARNVTVPFDVVSNPEFLKQGDAINDFRHSDRIIIGSESEFANEKMQALYDPLHAKIIFMDICSAELSKYAANAFLATKISFINEIAQFADMFGADVEKVRLGVGSDSRIGPDFLKSGCGYGGSCFPKDVKALIWMAREYNIETPLFNAVENINIRQKHLIFNRIKRFFDDLEGKVIAVWGLAFKPNTDDMREAPSCVLLESLWREGAKVRAYDPVAAEAARKIYGERANFVLCNSPEQVLEGADVLTIVTEWNEFRSFDIGVLQNKLKTKIIFDGRNLFDPQEMTKLGFNYYCIGRNKLRINHEPKSAT